MKVTRHDHITRKFGGSAHQEHNLSLNLSKKASMIWKL